eukprot:TRINITY_DN66192_c5_g1_i1.p2 TRINITY_DN66192_c5_g1~~TRINITY_DN66192_c5_g1_i1.p2  ORF type:complete len:589 (-),score=320.82 TRINITY_DN66192_c5_g1_i1:110-1876(-)
MLRRISLFVNKRIRSNKSNENNIKQGKIKMLNVVKELGETARLEDRAALLARFGKKKNSSENESSKNSKKKADANELFNGMWGEGTGYGHDSGASEYWDVSSMAQFVQKRNAKQVELLGKIHDALAQVQGEEAKVDDDDAAAGDKHASDKNNNKVNKPNAVVDQVAESCLLVFLYDTLAQNSLTDMEKHNSTVVLAVLDVVKVLAHHEHWAKLLVLDAVPQAHPSLRAAAKGKSVWCALQHRAALARRVVAKDDSDDSFFKKFADAVAAIEKDSKVAESADAEDAQKSKTKKKKKKTVNVDDLSDEKKEELRDKFYERILAPLRFGEADLSANKCKHAYVDQTVAKPSRAWMRRLMTEYADLGESLPINTDSSCFFRASETDMSKAQMLIIPSLTTPYGGGCFVFDLFFPDNFPGSPPKVTLATTGNGTVGFNPNLYNNGYVCLSLLGTWGGNGGSEEWTTASTILQVAVSIQSLVFVPQPWFNEPGYESSINDPSTQAQSKKYNATVRGNTIQWAMLDMIKNPPAAFSDVVKAHFFMRQDAILANVEQWEAQDSQHANRLNQLREAFGKLTKEDCLLPLKKAASSSD